MSDKYRCCFLETGAWLCMLKWPYPEQAYEMHDSKATLNGHDESQRYWQPASEHAVSTRINRQGAQGGAPNFGQGRLTWNSRRFA